MPLRTFHPKERQTEGIWAELIGGLMEAGDLAKARDKADDTGMNQLYYNKRLGQYVEVEPRKK